MPNYNETPINAGSRWNRATRVVIDNKYGVTPTIDFVEEMAMSDGQEVLVKPLGRLSIPFDPAATIDLVNPETGEPLGQTMTHAQMYVALHSLYIQLATARDTEQSGE